MPTAILETLSEIVVEELPSVIEESLCELDPVGMQIATTEMGVARDKIGRDYKVKHTFSGAICGAHAWRSPMGENVIMDGSPNADGFTIFGNGHSWQGLGEIAGPGLIQVAIQLVQGIGNFAIPMDIMRYEELSATQGSPISLIMKGYAKRHNLARIHALWKTTTNNTIGGYTSPVLGFSITTTPQTVTLTSGRIRNFFPGLLLDVYDTTGVTQINNSASSIVAVVGVNSLNRQLIIRTVSGTAVLAASTAYQLKPHRISQYSPDGFLDWIRTAGTLFGGTLNLTTYPQFRSIVDMAYGGALESRYLNNLIGGFEQAYGMELDTVLMTPGTMLSFIENLESTAQLIRFDVQGSAVDVQGGFQGFGYKYMNKPYRIMLSNAIPVGEVFIVKLKGKNLKKYQPPRQPGSKSDTKFAGEIEFVAPLMGAGNSIFLPVISTATGSQTNMLHAPSYTYTQFCPTVVQGIRAGTFTDSAYVG